MARKVNFAVWQMMLICFFSLKTASASRGDYDGLYNKLMSRYSPQTAPGLDTKVKLRIEYLHGDLDVNTNIMTHTLWLSQEWTDKRLTWAKRNFDDIGSISLPPSSVWLPDIRPFNSIGLNSFAVSDTNVVVYESGMVSWIPPVVIKAPCFPGNITGTLRCQIKLGSWTRDGFQLDLMVDESHPLSMVNYIYNDKYQLIHYAAERTETVYECCPEPYISVTVNIDIQPKHHRN